ncbi:MAG: filamentous hemagglutinin family protein [Verrucomicrobia bacterium]|nr:filamentous hemagglutinin family protein [Verrucomicrobiota bacterium]
MNRVVLRTLLAVALALTGSGRMLVAGDILRGGASAGSGRKAADARANSGAAAAELARTKAADRLARTTQVVTAMRQMQASARSASGSASVPDGLVTGGLERLPGGAWKGANAPAQSGNLVTIKQTDQQAVLNWKTFNVGRNTTVNFDQSAGGSDTGKWIAFNKVTDPSGKPSQILGSIKADGQVYIINQNGILFGAGSQVNTRTFVASTLPINETLVNRGLLSQTTKDVQFLFTSGGADAGVVRVDQGAVITSLEGSDGNGGRIVLVGKNVTNSGTLSASGGQTILASGLEVGFTAHDTTDASLRGLDVFVGQVGGGGTTTNNGLIQIARGSAWLAGKTVDQQGVIDSTTSVSLNGRVDLTANYNSSINSAYDSADISKGLPFLVRASGLVRLGEESLIRILPETSSSEKKIGTTLALRSEVNIQGRSVFAAAGSKLLAPNARVHIAAGNWLDTGSAIQPSSAFAATGGQVFLDSGSLVDVSGSTGVSVPIDQSILTLALRGAELADSPLQRAGAIRGIELTVDIRRSGTYLGRSWVGTPLGDVTGYANLIGHTVGQLTTSGGSVSISAGESIITREDALIDVSGGWVRNEGGRIQTTRLMRGNSIVDIAEATPNVTYDGIYSGKSFQNHSKWGIGKSFLNPLAPTGGYSARFYIEGAGAGSVSLSAPAMALDGALEGNTVGGPRQLRSSKLSSSLPRSASLTLAFHGQDSSSPAPLTTYSATRIIVQAGGLPPPGAFATDAAGNAVPISAARKAIFYLDPALLSEKGFGQLTVNNEEGAVVVPGNITLRTPEGGGISFAAANIDVRGGVVSPGGSLSFTSYNISPYAAALMAGSSNPTNPTPNPGKGTFTLEKSALLSTAGLIVDDRPTGLSSRPVAFAKNGGSITIAAFDANLEKGSLIDVSGGVSISSTGAKGYGNGGSISIKTGQDPGVLSALGGGLDLGAGLKGFAGGTAGSLTLQARVVEIGESRKIPASLFLNPAFFSSGGFGSFTITGLGNSEAGQAIPAVSIASGTELVPVALGLVLQKPSARGATLGAITRPVGERTPVSLKFTAPGVFFNGALLQRGDIVMGERAVIRTDPGGAVELSGNTVSVLGSIYSPGGTIRVSGGTDSTKLFNDSSAALATVFIGPAATLSAAGTFVLSSDPYGRKLGTVLPGGTISVSGNILAAAGSVLDASGAREIVDEKPTVANVNATLKIPASSGLTQMPSSLKAVPTVVASNAGTISLQGGQMLYSDAALRAFAGGPAAMGGTLLVSSGRFYPVGSASVPTDVNLTVRQSGRATPGTAGSGTAVIGNPVVDSNGQTRPGEGLFSVDQFAAGGFDSLALNGVVKFSGPVRIDARSWLKVADSGVLNADSTVSLSAPYVALGMPFQAPAPSEDRVSPFPVPVAATAGSGKLNVTARVVDIGSLSLQQIGNADISAEQGDIRGSGTLNIAGSLTLRAAQIYPTTGSVFSIIASDHVQGGTPQKGVVTILPSGSTNLPLSAGGTLEIYASEIHQNGVLRAPFGSIVLGWDGSGSAPKNFLSGSDVPASTSVSLGVGSLTSVSAIDPLTGAGLIIPYGVSSDGSSWIDPRGIDVTTSGLADKSIRISAQNLLMESGATVDIRGGGDLLAYRWIEGQGGSRDILGSDSSFAVLPDYNAVLAPFGPYNSSSASTNLISGFGSGYRNATLHAGDRIYLAASKSLPGGYYTLLPARYALLPGAVLVTPASGTARGTLEIPGGASIVSGYRFNGLSAGSPSFGLASKFEVLSSAVLRNRAEYETFSANSLISQRANELGVASQKLPADSGYLLLRASSGLVLGGSVLSQPLSGGRGASVDIDTPLNIVISSAESSSTPGTSFINSSLLGSWNAASLVVGGVRTTGDGSTRIDAHAESVTVDNAGSPLVGTEIVLVANQGLTLAQGSQIQQSGELAGSAENFVLSGSAEISAGHPFIFTRADGTITLPVGTRGSAVISSVSGSIVAADGTVTALAANSPVSIAAGSKITLSAAGTLSLAGGGTPVPLSVGDGVMLRVTSDASASSSRTSLGYSDKPSLVVASNARITGRVIALDSTAKMTLAPTALISADSYSLSSGKVSIQLPNAGALPSSAGLVLGGDILDNFQNASALAIRSYSSMDFYGSGLLGSPALNSLSFSAGELVNQGLGNVRVAADFVRFDNRNGGASLIGNASPAGSLTVEAKNIQLGANQIAINRFADVVFSASESISGEGVGGVSTQGGLALITPVLKGEAGSDRSFTANSGTLSIQKPSGSADIGSGGGLGATLTLTGPSVSINSNILLPSGSVVARATAGNLNVSGRLDVSGTQQAFYDVVKYTGGGEIKLWADSGNVSLDAGSFVDVSAAPGGGNAGAFSVSVPGGIFSAAGSLSASAAAGYQSGAFSLDILSLPDLSAYSGLLTASSFLKSQSFRVRGNPLVSGSGDVRIRGTVRANNFSLSADAGSIQVGDATAGGTIDASGTTGGSISLSASGDVVVWANSLLTVHGETFSNAGKGGTISLESGSQRNGSAGSGRVKILSGSTLDLGVTSKIVLDSLNPANDVLLNGSSAYNGQFSGRLAIRAPQNSGATDVLVDAINGHILDASSVTVEGYRLYDLTGTGGLITNTGTINAAGGLMTGGQNVQGSIRQNGVNFLGSSGSASAGYTAMLNRLLANNSSLAPVFVITPGAEIINRNGDLTLGSTASTTTSDWNFITSSAATTFRFGPKSAPGMLTMRASGNLVFYNALSDGFTPTLASSDTTWLWLARLSTRNLNLPVNTQSWTFRLTAGADLSAADSHRVLPVSVLSSAAGNVRLGKNNGQNVVANVTTGSASSSALTASAVANRYQVIRTGTGDIDISVGRSVQILNQFATIYTAGSRVTNPTLGGTFDNPVLLQNDTGGTADLGSQQQVYPALYSMAGGNVSLYAQQNIERLTTIAGQTIADSQFQMPDNWLYRRGYVGSDGQFAIMNIGNVLASASTTWWIDFSNFFQGVGALGGGDVKLTAGRNVSNVDAVIPTNARMARGTPDAASLLELGGGDLLVKAGSDIDAGVFYVERGIGTLSAGGKIKTNPTREIAGNTSAIGLSDSATWLPTTLFLGKGGFKISARGDVILGPVANPFLLPGGLGNAYYYKTYFSTYGAEDYVDVSSIGGSITLRESASFGGSAAGLLDKWHKNKLLWSPTTPSAASYARPWLRLSESNVDHFASVFSALPSTLRATSFAGDLNFVGNLTLYPSPVGGLELLARGAINGLQPNAQGNSPDWGYSTINVSDSAPSAFPGITTPFSYQKISAVEGSPSKTSSKNFLQFIDDLLIESGATAGPDVGLQAMQARHTSGNLHAGDNNPVRLYAATGDISGITLFAPKASRIFSCRDISDVSLYLQNLDAEDISIVSAGRDIFPYNSNSVLRTAAASGIVPTNSLPGDLQISGPGALEILAGRNLDLGTGASLDLVWKVSSSDGLSSTTVTAKTGKQALALVQANTVNGKLLYPWSLSNPSVSLATVADGLGAGIVSVGNARNPYLSFAGASLLVAAGIGPSAGLTNSTLDFPTFIENVVEGSGKKYLPALLAATNLGDFESLPDELKYRVALDVFFLTLRDAGREFAADPSTDYESGYSAIAQLIPAGFKGGILTRSRDIRTKNGGDIGVLIPDGGLTLSKTSIYETSTPPGIITESGGNISIFANDSVDIGIGRIFTLRGGNEIIWSSTGDIAAGASSKTVASAPPTRVLIDPQSAALQTDLAGLSTGGGIGVLATVSDVPPGDVDLIAPKGVVDAGDAGIRVTGNLNIAATAVLNAGNISAGGKTSGVPSAPTIAAPNIGGLTSASSSAAAANTAAQSVANQAQHQPAPDADLPSTITVEVLGYGGGENDSDG